MVCLGWCGGGAEKEVEEGGGRPRGVGARRESLFAGSSRRVAACRGGCPGTLRANNCTEEEEEEEKEGFRLSLSVPSRPVPHPAAKLQFQSKATLEKSGPFYFLAFPMKIKGSAFLHARPKTRPEKMNVST